MKPVLSSDCGKNKSLAYCILSYAVAGCGGWAIIEFGSFESTLAAAFAADLAGTVLIFIFSLIADNTSVYDPYWSIAPLPITLYWMISAGGWPALRQIIIAVLVLAWSVRLTLNWIRGWRGLGHEDWRYNGFRTRTGRAYWLISFAGFQLMPTLIVFLGLIPVNLAMNSRRGFNAVDALACVITAAAVLIEAVSDRRLRAFRQNRDHDRTSLYTGLWRFSRHPNYFGEVLFWWGLYLFTLAGSTRNAWSVVGPVSITLLFRFVSIPMMEKHLEERNPRYREETAHMSCLLPLPFSKTRTVRRSTQ
jgi:steroid 5-alpha reductase family enzyme